MKFYSWSLFRGRGNLNSAVASAIRWPDYGGRMSNFTDIFQHFLLFVLHLTAFLLKTEYLSFYMLAWKIKTNIFKKIVDVIDINLKGVKKSTSSRLLPELWMKTVILWRYRTKTSFALKRGCASYTTKKIGPFIREKVRRVLSKTRLK